MARYCNNCGGKMDEDVAFCPECGQKVINDEQYNTSIQSINDDGQGMQQVTNFNTGHYDSTTNNNSNSNDISQPGKGFAIASLVLGIVSLLFIIFFPLVGLVVSIVGVVCATKAKSSGYNGGMQTAGVVCSLIGLIFNGLYFVACVACVGMFGAAGTLAH